jgi:hypothetical protein
MQKLSDFVPAFSHHLKPPMRDGSQFTSMLFHPHIDGGIPLDSAVESQQFRSHRYSTVLEILRFRSERLVGGSRGASDKLGRDLANGHGR